jgi:hypothetical protein
MTERRPFCATDRVGEFKSRIDFDRKFAIDEGRMIVAFDLGPGSREGAHPELR